MSLWRFIRELFSSRLGRRSPAGKRYDNVRVTNVVDGSTITGHDAVAEYFDNEQKLHEEYGSSIIFQVYQLNLQASTMKELQGEQLLEVKTDSEFVTGSDTVAKVKEMVRSLLRERVQNNEGPRVDLHIEDADRITLYLGGRPMRDETLFYADNYIMLPVWVQVLLHGCEFEEVQQRIRSLSQSQS
jgi:hypothetical protein